MKKLIPFLLVLIFFVIVIPVHAQSGNWVALQSDSTTITAPGQTITVSLEASINAALNGAGIVLNYDPDCLKVVDYRPGTLLPNAVAFEQNVPGSLDLTYYYQGASQAIAGEGSLMEVTFEVLDVFDTSVTMDPAFVVLDRIDETGMAVGLPNVEFRNLAVQANGKPELATLTDETVSFPAASTSLSEPPDVVIPTSVVQMPMPSIFRAPFGEFSFLLISLVVIIASLLIVAVIVMLRHKTRKNAPGYRSSHRNLAVPALIVETGPQKGHILYLQGQQIIFGRLKNCQIRIDDHLISRQHAEIVENGGQYYLADFGSRNGTFLNRKQLDAGHYLLQDGDRIRLGKVITYRFFTPSS